MALLFKFDDKGKIYLNSVDNDKKISEEEFLKTCKLISVERFLKFISEEYKEEVVSQLNRLVEINKNKITLVGPIVCYESGKGFFVDGCYIGEKYFENYYNDGLVAKEAIKYGYTLYGEKFMKKILEQGILDKPSEEYMVEELSPNKPTPYVRVHFFEGEKEITKEDYFDVLIEVYNLTKIRNVKKPLDEEVKYINKKNDRKLKI